MTLQKIMIIEVDNFCGRERLVKKLQTYSKRALLKQEKTQFNILAVYYDALYKTTMDVESIVIQYRDNAFKTLAILNKYIEMYRCKFLMFVRKMIRRNLAHTTRVKRLA